jgi:hypothetical protein
LIHLECSAFTGENIETIFNLITKQIFQKLDDGILLLNEHQPINNIIDIKEPSQKEDQSRCSSC